MGQLRTLNDILAFLGAGASAPAAAAAPTAAAPAAGSADAKRPCSKW